MSNKVNNRKKTIILRLNVASVPIGWWFHADTQRATPSLCSCFVGVFHRPHFVGFCFFRFFKVSKQRFLKAETNKMQTLSLSLSASKASTPHCARLSIKPSSLIHRLIWVSLNSLITHSQIEDCNINSTQNC